METNNARGIERLEIEGDIREQIEREEVYRDAPKSQPLNLDDVFEVAKLKGEI